MINKILIIILSVTILGVVIFIIVRNALKKKIDFLKKESKKSKQSK